MIDETVVIQVQRSIEDAFIFVAEQFFHNHQRWDPAITDLIKLTDGPIGVGTEGRETRSFGGKQSADFRITEFDSPRRFAFTNTSGGFWLDRTYDFQPASDGTRIVFHFVMRPRTLSMRLLGPLVRRTIVGQVRENIQRLQRLLNADPVPIG